MPEITYQAAWSPEDLEVTVIQNIKAGISGPHGSYPAPDLGRAEGVLFEHGYHLAGTWREVPVGDFWVDLVRFDVGPLQ